MAKRDKLYDIIKINVYVSGEGIESKELEDLLDDFSNKLEIFIESQQHPKMLFDYEN